MMQGEIEMNIQKLRKLKFPFWVEGCSHLAKGVPIQLTGVPHLADMGTPARSGSGIPQLELNGVPPEV